MTERDRPETVSASAMCYVGRLMGFPPAPLRCLHMWTAGNRRPCACGAPHPFLGADIADFEA